MIQFENIWIVDYGHELSLQGVLFEGLFSGIVIGNDDIRLH